MNFEIKDLKKHEDERGYLLEILRSDEINEDIQQIYFSTSKHGAVRGGHYHKKKVEWFCVVKGKAKLVLEDNDLKEKEEMILSGDNPSIIKVPPNISHVIENIGDNEMHLIVISNEVFDPHDTDTFM